LDFPVVKRPPKTRFWPVLDQKHRAQDLRVRKVCRRLIRIAPELDDERFRPLILSFARISLLVHDSYMHLLTVGLLNADNELRSSVGTFQGLLRTQLSLAQALGLSPGALRALRHEHPADLASALAFSEAEDAETVEEAPPDGDKAK